MKHYLLYILIFMPFYLNCMEQNQEENRFSICNQIKQINPNARRATYLRLVKNLLKNNLSVCACMTYLMQEREKRAIELIKKNFVSQNSENVIKEWYKEQQQKDANEKSGMPLTIYCSPSLDPNTQARIAEKFSGKYLTTIVQNEQFCPLETPACAWRSSFLDFEKNIDGNSSVKFVAGNREIGINASFKTLSSNARNATLEHEKYHLEANHGILELLWNAATDFDLVNGRLQKYTHQQKFRAKLSRAHEAEADRIPAACNDCKLASDFVEGRGDYRCGLISGFITKMSNYFKKVDTSSYQPIDKLWTYHPSDKKRLQWAQRIYKLKLAEYEIKKNDVENF